MSDSDFSYLVGQTLSKIDRLNSYGEIDPHGDFLKFYTVDGRVYSMYHSQDCCENVYIESIEGDLEDLLNTPILLAEERTEDQEDQYDSVSKWTFYRLATEKGFVTIRWNGSSNGYYSVSVDFYLSYKKDE